MVARISAGLPRQTGRAALRAYRQRSRDEGQRLHLERLPGTQQQRTGSRLWQLREPCPAAYQEILRRHSARLWRTDRLRPRNTEGICRREDRSRETARCIQVPRCTEGSHEPGPHRQQVPGRHRTVEAGKDRYEPRTDHPAHRSATDSQPGHCLRTLPALQQRTPAPHAEHGKLRLGQPGTHRPAARRTSAGHTRTAVRED